MRLTISALQMKMTDGIKGYISEKLKKFEKYLSPETDVKVTVSAKKARQHVEVTISQINGRMVRAEDSEEDLYAAIDVVVDKLNRQIIKYKEKFKTRQPGAGTIRYENSALLQGENQFYDELDDQEFDFEDEEFTIKKRKKFNIKPMSPEEAILQMELSGHNFFIFTNQDSFETNVVYKRKTSGYGLIESIR
ncbi:MAG: ribosome-associated translation inhibitor RaiA [Clostridioides sp.]|jgi:putative sigma-54 modulation protein|nr:ribosome-associated translation inhibitor RaiA [Clostridioides sp.]